MKMLNSTDDDHSLISVRGPQHCCWLPTHLLQRLGALQSPYQDLPNFSLA